jgi:hypothetical protein
MKTKEQIEARISQLKALHPGHHVATATNRAGVAFIARWCLVRQRYGSDLQHRRTIKRLMAWEPI